MKVFGISDLSAVLFTTPVDSIPVGVVGRWWWWKLLLHLLRCLLALWLFFKVLGFLANTRWVWWFFGGVLLFLLADELLLFKRHFWVNHLFFATPYVFDRSAHFKFTLLWISTLCHPYHFIVFPFSLCLSSTTAAWTSWCYSIIFMIMLLLVLFLVDHLNGWRLRWLSLFHSEFYFSNL